MQQQDRTHPTGVSSNKEDITGQQNLIRARDRKAHAAVEMLMAGATLDDICEVLGYPTPRTAQVAIELALENRLLSTDDKTKLRNLAASRLERLLRSVWPKAIDPNHPEHLNANTKARENIADFRRLYGLDAPSEVVVHSPTASAIEAWVSRVVQGDATVEEYDIVEGEWEEAAEKLDAVSTES